MTDNDKIDLINSERLLNYSITSYQRHVDNFDKIDSKAAILAGFIGVVLVLTGGFLAPENTMNWEYGNKYDYLQLVASIAYSSMIIMLAASFGFCLATLKTRIIVNPTSIKDMIKHYRSLGEFEKRERQLLKDMVKTISRAENSFKKNNVSKSIHLRRSLDLLFVALILGMIGYISNLLFTLFNI